MITDAYCRQSYHLVGKYLRRFVSDASDIEAASGMLWASSMGSMAFNVARVGLVDAMAHPLGAHYNQPHGIACGLLLPGIMEFNLMACPDKFVDVAIAMEGIVSGNRPMEKAYSSIEAVRRLIQDIGITADFSSYEITDDNFSRLPDETLSSGMQMTNPRVPRKKDVEQLFRNFFKEFQK
jgi:alcohol dehydrogenase class IV